jgi:DNA modification methylase
MTKKQTVQITEAKGRPMLHWVGKRPLDHITAFPAQLVERFDPLDEQAGKVSKTSQVPGNLLFHGDNKDVLAWLLANGYRGKVKLVYIDPPFDSGADYVRRVELRSVKGAAKLASDAYTLREQIQYTDIWTNDTYLQFMYERLILLKELLSEDGNIFLHCDAHRNYLLRCILEEVFGAESFCNEIVREKQRGGKHHVKRALGSIHDMILHYSKGKDFVWHHLRKEIPDRVLLERYPHEDEEGRYALADCRNFSGVSRPNLTYEFLGFYGTWKWTQEEMLRKYESGEVVQIAAGNVPRRKVRPPKGGDLLQSLWYDVHDSNGAKSYPTEKSQDLLERIVQMGSSIGDLVLDCFIGSGTTAAVAQRLGRRWIAADINKGAIQTTSKRLQAIIRQQVETQPTLPNMDNGDPPPAALSFSVYRINDYDLQVQHNEAVNLAVEMIGIERLKTDVFFDGTLGKRLVKIVPFNHPLTPLDLQLLQDEFKARPDEERDAVVVCLGKEIAADAWLNEYNKQRPVNKIEVIELRTDQRYGKFFVHQPAQAQVRVARQASEVLMVEIEDFISPSIVERLEMDTPIFKVQIPDWRAMVDVVLIDTAYDSEVFNITLSDVPERKNDLVSGRYELAAPEGPTTVAVKIIDMLGEEVLVTVEV